jgi:hypothetical protein
MDRRDFLVRSTLAAAGAAFVSLRDVQAAVTSAPTLAPAPVAPSPAGAFVPAAYSPMTAWPIPSHLTLTLTGDPATTQAVTWCADANVPQGFLQFQAGDALTAAANHLPATPRELVTDLGHTRLFTAVPTGLSPGTKYTYRVGNGTIWSQPHSFTTAQESPAQVKFLLFGDSQSGCSEPLYMDWAMTVHNAYRANPDANFMVNMGDLVECGQSGAHWEGWYAGAQGVIDSIPQMAVQGNHETYPQLPDPKDPTHKRLLASQPVVYKQELALPQNGPVGLKDQVYSWDYGPVHMVVLDSQQEEEMGNLLQTQVPWLDADLAASSAPWKLVFFHRTAYEVKPIRPNPVVRAAFCPIIDKHHADLVFNGHDHAVARTFPIFANQPVEKPSQGTIYYVTGRSGHKTYPDLAKHRFDSFFYDPQRQPNYQVVTIAGPKLTVATMNQDGTLVDTFTLDKGADASSDSGLPLPKPVGTN